ncbi:MAG TPA: peptidylprolyl isomerase [Myxococcota bacterium]|jgi:peptidyl-prolyl cis-trans isomerase SurA|nr:peptidylprolyl isomerase [Myxococcota bacterium]
MPSPSSAPVSAAVRRIPTAAAAFALSLLVVPIPGGVSPARAEELVDGIAAQVGSEVVLVSEVDELVKPIEARARAEGATDADIESLRSDALDRLIERHAIAQAAKRAELDASEGEIDDAIASIAKENNITVDQVKRNVESGGLTWETYRAKIRGEIVQAKVVNGMVRSKVRVSDEDVRRLYDEKYSKIVGNGGEEIHLRHIIVTFGKEQKRNEAEACGLVKDGLAKIKSGTPFDQVASKISEANPERGGDAGWVPVNAMPSWMVDATSKLDGGQVSDVVRMPFGCNLFQVVERRKLEKRSFDEVKNNLRSMLIDERTEGEYRKFMDKLRSQTYIERRGSFATVKASPTLGLPPVGASSERDHFQE